MHFGRSFLNKPLKMNKEKSSNDFLFKNTYYKILFSFGHSNPLCRALDRNWPEASLNMVMRNIQVVIISCKTHLLHVLFSYPYKSSITLEIPLRIPITPITYYTRDTSIYLWAVHVPGRKRTTRQKLLLSLDKACDEQTRPSVL